MQFIQVMQAMQDIAHADSHMEMFMKILVGLITLIGTGGGIGFLRLLWVLNTKHESLQKEVTEHKENTRSDIKELFADVGNIATENQKYREDQLERKVKELEDKLKENKP